MSRIGKLPIKLGDKTKAVIAGKKVNFEGPKGKLSVNLPAKVKVEIKDGNVLVVREDDSREARSLHGLARTILANASEEGHLYGSVTARDVARELAGEGLEVDPRCIQLDEPIKEVGNYKVKVRLHAEVECEVKVWVVKGDDSYDTTKRSSASAGTDEDTDEDERGS